LGSVKMNIQTLELNQRFLFGEHRGVTKLRDTQKVCKDIEF
jgi:hypothetical protein